MIRLNNKSVVFVILFLTTSVLAFAQKLNLNQTLEKAIQNNYAIKAAELFYESARLEEKTIIAFPKTNVNALIGQTNSIRFDENISIVQDIRNPASVKAEKMVASVRGNLVKQEAEINKREILFNIQRNWYECLYYLNLKKILSYEDSILTAFVKVADLKHRSGEGKLLEKNIAETKKQQLQQLMLQNEMNVNLSKLKIQQEIGLNADFEFVDTLTLLDYKSLTDSILFESHPMIQYIRNQINLSEAEAKNAKMEMLPDFSGGYFIQSLSGPQDVNGQTRSFNSVPVFQGVSIGINVPVFNLKAYKTKQEMFLIEKAANEKLAENALWNLNQKMNQNITTYNFLKQHLKFYNSSAIPNSEMIIKNASKSYQNGEIEYVEYLQALQSGIEIKKNHLHTINLVNQSVIELWYLTN